MEVAESSKGWGASGVSLTVPVQMSAAVHDDLQVAKAAAVVERNKAKVLHVADGLDPAGDGDGLAAERLGIGIELRDFGAVHVSSHNG